MTNPVYIVYVCRGNRIRSPAAKEITRQLAEKKGLEVIVDSVGIDVKDSLCMLEPMNLALKNMGFSIKGHSSKKVLKELLEPADYIFCMRKYQVEKVLELVPEKKGIIYTLQGFIGYGDKEIQYPQNRITKSLVTSFLEKILFLSANSPNKCLRAKFLDMLGKFMHLGSKCVYRRDKSGIDRVYRETAEEIRVYVDMALTKIFGYKYKKSDI